MAEVEINVNNILPSAVQVPVKLPIIKGEKSAGVNDFGTVGIKLIHKHKIEV